MPHVPEPPMTPTKIADPLLPEQIAELRAAYEAATDGLAHLHPEAQDSFRVLLHKHFPQLLSAAERGIAAGGGEVERLERHAAVLDRLCDERLRRIQEAEANLAVSNARITALEDVLRRARPAVGGPGVGAPPTQRWAAEQQIIRAEIDALLTPTHPETTR